MDVKEIRVENLRRLIDDRAKGNQRQFAEDHELNKAHVSQMLTRHRDMGDKVARQLEKKLGLAHGFMDRRHDDKQMFLTDDELALIEAYRSATPPHRIVAHNYLRATPEQRDMFSEEIITKIFKDHLPDERLGC